MKLLSYKLRRAKGKFNLLTVNMSKEIFALISFFKDPIIELFHEVKSEINQFIDDGLSKYLENQWDKFSNTKTFLFRNEKVPFYEIFFPISILSNEIEYKADENILKIFKKNNFISIIGSAGSGKSMLLKHVFLTSIIVKDRIPIVIELRNLNEYNGSITDYIENIILPCYFP
jgi:ABC-type bacteriocin/lantibiotic exporter with double-glycine peptidase domain